MDTLNLDLYRVILSMLDGDDWINFRYTCKDIYNSVTAFDIQYRMTNKIKYCSLRLKMLLLDIRNCRLTNLCTICDHMVLETRGRLCTVCNEFVCNRCVCESSFYRFKCCDYEIYMGTCNRCVDTFRSCSICSRTLCPSAKDGNWNWICQIKQCSNCNKDLCATCNCFCNVSCVYCM